MSDNWDTSAAGVECSLDPFQTPPVKLLWGVAPTGDIHLGYASYICLLRQLRRRGTQPLILIANYHAYLDSQKTEWSQLNARTSAYRRVFELAGFPDIVETRDFYLNKEYIESLFEISGWLGIRETLRAGGTTLHAEETDAKIADLMYVATQILDVRYLGVDSVLCGIDEAPIYRFGLPMLARTSGIRTNYIYMPMCPGVEKPEMHASDVSANKILISDDETTVKEKVQRHFNLSESRVEPALACYCRDVLFPVSEYAYLSDELAKSMATRRSDIIAENVSDSISLVLESLQQV